MSRLVAEYCLINALSFQKLTIPLEIDPNLKGSQDCVVRRVIKFHCITSLGFLSHGALLCVYKQGAELQTPCYIACWSEVVGQPDLQDMTLDVATCINAAAVTIVKINVANVFVSVSYI